MEEEEKEGKNGKSNGKVDSEILKVYSASFSRISNFPNEENYCAKLRVHIIERTNVSITGEKLFNQTSRVSFLSSMFEYPAAWSTDDPTILFQ